MATLVSASDLQAVRRQTGQTSSLSVLTFVSAAAIPGYAAAGDDYVSRDFSVRMKPGSVSFPRSGLTISFPGTGPITVEGRAPAPARMNYFLGSDPSRWRSVEQFQRVRYRGIYPGVDLDFHALGGDLEYDFLLSPGADPSRIRIRFEASGAVRIRRNGDLEVDCGREKLVQKQPVAYQIVDNARRRVPARYILVSRTEARLRIGAYDRRKPLVIDPVLAYSTLFASGYSPISDMAADRFGFVYVGGSSDSDVASKNGFGTNGPAYVAKFDPTKTGAASLLYAAAFDGGAIKDLATDGAGNLYVAGDATGAMLPVVGGFQTRPAALPDAFVLKFNTLAAGTSSLTYGSYVGGSGIDTLKSMAVDGFGNIFLSGSTNSADFPFKGGFQSRLAGGFDAFVVKLSPASPGAASLAYASYLGAAGGNEAVRSIALDQSGRLVILGTAESGGLPLKNAFQAETSGVFLAKVDASITAGPSLVFCTYFGGNNHAFSLALDAADNIYLAGEAAQGGIPTQGAYQSSIAGTNYHAYVSVLDAAAATLLYSTYLAGSNWEQAQKIAVDPSGAIYVAGATASRDFPLSGAFQTYLSGQYDGFVAKLDPALSGEKSLLYSTYVGGSGLDDVMALSVDGSGAVTVAGTTSSGDFPLRNPFQATFGGSNDGFVARIDPGRRDYDSLIYSSYIGGSDYDGVIAIVPLGSGRTALAGATASADFPVMNAYQPSLGGVRGGFLAVVSENASCGYSFRSGGANFSAAGGTGTVQMAASNGCAWSAVPSDPWITVTSGASGAGAGNINYSVAANPFNLSRSGAIYAAGQGFYINQSSAACSYSLSSYSASFVASAGTRSVGVTASAPDCAWSASTDASWITIANPSGVGSGAVSLLVDANTGPARTAALLIAGRAFAVMQESGIKVVISGVVNAASFGPNVSRGSWVAISGDNLAQTTRSWSDADFNGNRLPASLDGVTVQIGGTAAAISYISPTQINALLPPGIPVGPANAILNNGFGSAVVKLSVDALAPAMFVFNPGGRLFVAAVHSDGTYCGKSGLFSGANSRPARPGEHISLFGSGFGDTRPAAPSGTLFEGALPLAAPVAIRIGSALSTVEFAGLSGVGLYQFNIVVPDVPDGDQPVIAQIGGIASQTGVYLTIQH